jgi:hypothetical protein
MEYFVLLDNTGSVETILKYEVNDLGEGSLSSVDLGLGKPKTVSELGELITKDMLAYNAPTPDHDLIEFRGRINLNILIGNSWKDIEFNPGLDVGVGVRDFQYNEDFKGHRMEVPMDVDPNTGNRKPNWDNMKIYPINNEGLPNPNPYPVTPPDEKKTSPLGRLFGAIGNIFSSTAYAGERDFSKSEEPDKFSKTYANLKTTLNPEGDGFSENGEWAYYPYDPLILDLNHNGLIDTVNIDNGVYFDGGSDDFSEKMGWVSGGDGLLCVDRNGDNQIDSSELLGNTDIYGFDMLRAMYDRNWDGVIDNNDPLFSSLSVWVDNGNGITEEGELKTLSELGITSISVNYDDSVTDSNGNEINGMATFTQNGEEHIIGDAFFQTNNMQSVYNKDYELTISAMILPILPTIGTVRATYIKNSQEEDFVALSFEYAGDIDKAVDNFEAYMAAWTGLDDFYIKNGREKPETYEYYDYAWMVEKLRGDDKALSKTATHNSS